MFDFEWVDKLYDVGQTHGTPFGFFMFDKRMLLPLSRLPDAVASETDEVISEDALRDRAEQGWFVPPLIPWTPG